MTKKVKCSECKNLGNSNSPETFINSQGVRETHHKKRYRCEADISKYFSDKEIKEIQECDKFRTRILSLWQELFQKLRIISGLLINFFLKKILNK